MINYSDFFIAIYTNECKEYCDGKFFHHLFSTDIGNAHLHIIDNTINTTYMSNLKALCVGRNVHHINVQRNEDETQFVRNVAESVSFLRDIFLKTDCKYFVIVESDVLPPHNWLHYFLEVIDKADIIGGIYYKGFHPQEFFDSEEAIFQETNHVLSGCTLYKREVIEKIPFRWSPENMAAFPDAWICYDSGQYGFRKANYSKIKCDHLEKPGSMVRGRENLR